MLPFLSTAVATSKSENRNPCNNFGVAVENELSPPQIFELGGYNICGSRNQLLVLIYTGGQHLPCQAIGTLTLPLYRPVPSPAYY